VLAISEACFSDEGTVSVLSRVANGNVLCRPLITKCIDATRVFRVSVQLDSHRC